MFETEMKEGINRRIDVYGVEPQIMELLLHTLYTGDISHLLTKLNGDMGKTGGMIEVADMYLLHDVKETCFLHLLDRITLETAGDITVLSYYHTPSPKIGIGITKFCQE